MTFEQSLRVAFPSGESARRGRRLRRLMGLPGVLCAVVLALGSCAPTNSQRDADAFASRPTHGDPGERLAQLAEQESSSRRLTPRSVAVPPGLPLGALALIDRERATSTMPLEQALKQLADHAESREAFEAPRAWLREPALNEEQAVRHYVQGRDAAQREQFDVAIRELLLAHNFDARSVAVARELARVYVAVRNQPAAADMYDHLLALAPDDGEAVLALALHAEERRDFARAGYLLANHRLSQRDFAFDPAGEALAHVCLFNVLDELGYDTALAEQGGLAAAHLESPPAPGLYAASAGAMYRQRGDLWLRIGDAYCRLGAFDSALRAYEESRHLPLADSWSLLPRRIYVLLCLGREYAAQQVLLQRLSDPGEIDLGARDVRLCEYLASQVQDRGLLAEAALQLHNASPGGSALARCAASLLDRPRAIEVLDAFISANAADLAVLQQFLDWMAAQDLSAAVELSIGTAEKHPMRAAQLASALLHAAIDPTPLIAALEQGDDAPMRSCLRAHVHQQLGDLGQAWQVASDAALRWPSSGELARVRIALATELQEPALLDEALADAEPLNDVATWVTRAKAHRGLKSLDSARTAIIRAMELDREDAEVLLELARLQTTIALAQGAAEDVRMHGWDAVQTTQQLLRLHPNDERAYELALFIFGSEGPLPDASAVEEYMTRLTSQNPHSALLRRVSLESAFRQQRYEDALEIAIELYEQSPASSEMLSLAISAWSAMDGLDQADAWITTRRVGRAQDPSLLEPWVRVKMMRSEISAAQRELESLCDASPQNFRAMQLLEAVYRASGDFDRAIELGERRLTSRPLGVQRELARASMFAESARDAQAAERLQWIADQGGTASIEQLGVAIQISDSIEHPKQLRDALILALIDRVVLLHPEVSMASYITAMHSMHGMHEQDVARRDALIGCVAQRAETDPAGGRLATALWREVAQQCIDLGDPSAASRLLRARLAAEKANDPELLGVLLMTVVIADAAAGVPTQDTMTLLEATYPSCDFSRFAQRGEVFSLADLLFEAANLHAVLGNNEASALLLERCLVFEPDQHMAMNNLGYQRIEAGRDDEASIALIERAYELNPTDANILDTIGWLRYKQGRLADELPENARVNEENQAILEGEVLKPQLIRAIPGAISLIRRAIELAETPSAEVHDHLGDALWRDGNRNGAIDQWRRAQAILENEEWRMQRLLGYSRMQREVWGLQVMAPEAIHDRAFTSMTEAVKRKIDQAVGGAEVQVAPLFEGIKMERDEQRDGRP